MKNRALRIYVIFAICFCIISQFISINNVIGTSMQPTLYEGDTVILLKYITPRDGDIVVIDTSKVPTYKQDAPYIIKRYYTDKSTDGYYVLGDNTNSSYDSRYFGEIPKDAISAVVLYHFNISALYHLIGIS